MPTIRNTILLSCFLVLCIMGITVGTYAQETRTIAYDTNGRPYIAGEVIVKYQSESPAARIIASGLENEPYQNTDTDTHVIDTTQRLHYSIEADLSSFVPGMQLASIEQVIPIEIAVQMLEQSQDIEYAEPNYLISLGPIEQAAAGVQDISAFTLEAAQLPNDPRYPEQWGLTKISADKAWEITTGKQDIIIAVIDSGVDYNHPDLAANIWKNPREIPNNGIDDDGNRYIDDVYGYDFINKKSDPTDDNGHGTHVAGIIGAVGNNGIGVAGMNWNVKIMPLKFMDAKGNGDVMSAVNAIYYAKQMGADIISCSWTGAGYSQALEDAIRQTNLLFVVSAGNGGADSIGDDNDRIPQYPASWGYSNMITVAATDASDVLATLSNYGQKTVHVAAPGVEILSTYPTNKNSYTHTQGTSMATAFVSGIAGLMLAADPNLSPAQLKSLIIQSVDKVPALSSKVSSGGRVNAEKAVIAARGGSITPTPTPLPTLTTPPTPIPTQTPTPTPLPTLTTPPTPIPTLTPTSTPFPPFTIPPTSMPTLTPTSTPTKIPTPSVTKTTTPVKTIPPPSSLVDINLPERFKQKATFPGIPIQIRHTVTHGGKADQGVIMMQ